MKNIILLSCALLALLFTSSNSSAEEPFKMTPDLGCATLELMLVAKGIIASCRYQAVDGYGNSWLVIVEKTEGPKYGALGWILLFAESFDRSIPSKTNYILASIGDSIFSAPMPETRSCLKGVGIKGIDCVVPHIKEGHP